MPNLYPFLQSPGKISGLELNNRIIMPAMSTNFASASGTVTDKIINYYRARAEGGAGLIIIENTNVDYPSGKCGAVQLRIDDNCFMPGLYDLAEAIHHAGGKAAIQLNHGGITAKPDRLSGGEVVAPSAIPYQGRAEKPRELSEDQIHQIAQRFGEAAARARQIGFDAVEVHGSHGYLLSEFLSPVTNQRRDAFGGTLDNRLRFPLLVVQKVREAVGLDFPVFFRVSADEFHPEGNGLSTGIQIAKRLETAGVDAIHVTAGTQFNPVSRACLTEPMSFAQGWKAYLAEAVKREVRVPVITVGVIREPELAENILAGGKADFVALGRALIADPLWPRKAFAGRGGEIRRCISCRTCSSRRNFQNLPIACAVNPLVGREGERDKLFTPAQPKRVFVAGGGPAGLQAAETAAARGHAVILFEKEPSLGGQLKIAAVPPGKDKLAWAREDKVSAMHLAQVEVRLGEELTPSILEKERPDALIIASGSTPIRPRFVEEAPPGMVCLARDILDGSIVVSEKAAVVIGGGSVGCETALYLAESSNAAVTIVEKETELARELEQITRVDLLEKLREAGIKILAGVTVLKVQDGTVEINDGGEDRSLPAGRVILALGSRSQNQLGQVARTLVPEVYEAGDCVRPGRVFDAVASGFQAGIRV